ncbi:phosphate propanoyltransferase [Domibacillus mangrovi]|uniref:Phosphate propanoyltransferase n=1 Tax=Domibacillus mangrovi TaxID=1714354 RepID=A0A1Q5P5J6_9BACI|nr:phosphate propanoyltransferase [Domibacillus mangrovi]OKL37497.1 propanediol utilization protein [Domibacillus mangrovi]
MTFTNHGTIPVAVSARHVHLSQEHLEILFGSGHELTKRVDLSQPGQFAAEETVTIAGKKSEIARVRVLGPCRPATQVEVSLTDAVKLGAKLPLRESGDIQGSGAVTITGPAGSIELSEGLIIAKAHVHMTTEDAKKYNVENSQIVTVAVSGERPVSFHNVVIRVSDSYALEMHIDTDEANAGFISQGATGEIWA